MNVVFDIDDTITDETAFVIKYAPGYLKRKYRIHAELKNSNGYNLSELFGLPDIFKVGTYFDEAEIAKKCSKIENRFWNDMFFLYILSPCRKGVRRTVKELKERGINVYFVTCRGKKTKEKSTFFSEFIRLNIVPILTKIQLKINLIKYNGVIVVENEEQKLEFIKSVKASFVFDDQLSLLTKLPEFSSAICVETPHNVNDLDNENIMSIKSFLDNQVKEIILKGYKSPRRRKYYYIKWYEYRLTESFYMSIRCIWRQFFIKKFKPTVYGREKVPNDKRPIIYAGNHRNNFDPFIIATYIKHPIHWCALLRLFKAEENLLGSSDRYVLRKITSIVLKYMGAIPIARSADENYRKINVLSLLKADEYIKLGSSIGFFPEGTINRKPQEVDILPAVSDAVFQIAKRNECWLQPFSIVWVPENVQSVSKVIVVFSDAIETVGMKVEEIKEKWEQEVKRGIEEAKETFARIGNEREVIPGQ